MGKKDNPPKGTYLYELNNMELTTEQKEILGNLKGELISELGLTTEYMKERKGGVEPNRIKDVLESVILIDQLTEN